MSVAYQKKGTRPSFGMTMTQDIRDLFGKCIPPCRTEMIVTGSTLICRSTTLVTIHVIHQTILLLKTRHM